MSKPQPSLALKSRPPGVSGAHTTYREPRLRESRQQLPTIAACDLAFLDCMQQRDAKPWAAVPVPGPEAAQRALADVRGILAGHPPEVRDEQLPARAQHPHGLVHRAV